MKLTFWKNKGQLIGAILLIVLSSICTLTFTIILPFHTSIWPALLLFSILLIGSLLDLFLNKTLLSKISFSDEHIQITWLKREICCVEWANIMDVKDTIYAIGSRYLTFILPNKKINIELTQKIYDTIMVLCPSTNVKIAINNIEYFKGFHKYK